ncbi:MAG TPA: potassium channel family protein, partial [Tepidisphaeraceae bacterium]
LTTVGYGDIAPQTPLGRVVASALMLLGYGVIAVPTGIVTAELVSSGRRTNVIDDNRAVCPQCAASGHQADAEFCRKCGQELTTSPNQPARSESDSQRA